MDSTTSDTSRAWSAHRGTGQGERESGSASGPDQAMMEATLYDIVEENTALLITKHRDYGPLNIAGWDRTVDSALTGLRVRMWDKVARINHLLDKGGSPEHESLADSFADLANYALIAQLVLRSAWPGINYE